MSRCIELAKNGLGTTYPNPLVGSVIVHNDHIIGEGWHYKAGQPHAEVNAIRSVLNKCTSPSEIETNKKLLQEATIYVSLEPCSHYGKTPPCADLISKHNIKKVVIGSTDPNPQVAGRGIQKLLDAGCEVVTGVLEKDCYELNKRFFTFHNKKRPYVVLKWAEDNNGFIAPLKREQQHPVWITNEYSRQWVHKLRTQEQGILIGTKTALEDNPSLTARDWYGHSPTRLVIDRNLKIPITANIYDATTKTIVITEMSIPVENKQRQNLNLNFEIIAFKDQLASQICEIAYKHNLQSFIVEGGAHTLQTFINEKLWDEAFVFKGTTSFKKGIKAPDFKETTLNIKQIQTDVLMHYKNRTV